MATTPRRIGSGFVEEDVGGPSHRPYRGLPMVILAMGADQPANAKRCQVLGLGISLDPVRVTPNEVRDGAASVLADPAFRRAAQQVQQDVAAQPAPMTAVGLLERLAADRAPLGKAEVP